VDLRCDKAPFTDIKVRKALQLTLNLKSIAENYYGGTVDGIPCGVTSPLMKGWVTPYDEWPEDLKAEYAYDLQAAKDLLTGAGYPDGFTTKCLASNGADLQLLQVIQAAFKDINVDMEIETMDMPTFWGLVTSGKHEQMAFNQLVGFPFAPDKTMLMRGAGDPQDNYTFNNDSHYESLISQFNAATSEDEARQLSEDADLYLLGQHWSVQTFPLAGYMVWQPYVKGYSGELLDGALWPAYCTARMWIDQTLKTSMGR
jgi:ABC-type transport system substrate-binding protein